MAEEAAPVILGPGEGTDFENPLGGPPLTFKVRGAETGDRVSAFESLNPPGEGPPLHLHVDQDEVLYVLEGELRVLLGDDVRPASAGSFVFIPGNVPHTWQVVGDTPARLLVILAPSGIERLYEGWDSIPEGTPIEDAFRELGREAGMKALGPPLAVSHPL